MKNFEISTPAEWKNKADKSIRIFNNQAITKCKIRHNAAVALNIIMAKPTIIQDNDENYGFND